MNFKKSNIVNLICLCYLTSTPSFAEEFSFDDKRVKKPESLVLFQAKDQMIYGINSFSDETKAQLERAISTSQFSAKKNEIIELLAPVWVEAERILLVGLGDKTLTAYEVNQLGGKIGNRFSKLDKQNIALVTTGMPDGADFSAELAHGIELNSYRFDRYKKTDFKSKHYHFQVEDSQLAKKINQNFKAIEEGVFLARDLTNTPASDMYPAAFVEQAIRLKEYGVKLVVLNVKDLKKLNMNALVGVGVGSEHEPKLLVAHWKGSKDQPIALVGKGITFDSGGYNIKANNKSMAHMKSDMAGAATILGTIKAMAMQNASVNVVAIMPLAENMVSERAQRPGDVVQTAQGLTVEITNTDAEGRLILSDGLWYAREQYQPKMIVDVATLTGAKYRALGREYAGIFSDSETMVTDLTYAGKQVGEKLWRLPLAASYAKQLESDIADLKNTGDTAGASTAAMFLKRFVGDSDWVHIDIAGNALTPKDTDLAAAGATGYGVRLLSYWLTK